jgi:hypothetical protein
MTIACKKEIGRELKGTVKTLSDTKLTNDEN